MVALRAGVPLGAKRLRLLAGVTVGFIVRSALNVASADEERLDDMQRRLARLEELVFPAS